MSNAISLAAMLFTLFVALGLDIWSILFSLQYSRTFNPTPIYVGTVASALVFAGILVSFSWLNLIRLKSSKLRALIFILIGSGITFCLPLLIPYPRLVNIFNRLDLTFLVIPMMDISQGRSFFIIASAYIFLVGLLDIFGVHFTVSKGDNSHSDAAAIRDKFLY